MNIVTLTGGKPPAVNGRQFLASATPEQILKTCRERGEEVKQIIYWQSALTNWRYAIAEIEEKND